MADMLGAVGVSVRCGALTVRGERVMTLEAKCMQAKFRCLDAPSLAPRTVHALRVTWLGGPEEVDRARQGICVRLHAVDEKSA